MPRLPIPQRIQAVRALLAGRPWSEVASELHISRGRLATLRKQALAAIAAAVADKPRARAPANRTPRELELAVREVALRHPTTPARRVAELTGARPRTVQRIRQRLGLPKLPKRPPPRTTRRSVPTDARPALERLRRRHPFLGPQRLAWALDIQHGIRVSPSWVRDEVRAALPAAAAPTRPVWRFYERHHPHSLWHADYMEKVYVPDGTRAYQLTMLDDYSRTYVFCELFLEKSAATVLYALLTAIEDYGVIPKAVLFDNGTPFHSKEVCDFCASLGIAIIYSSPRHPQTNGKLERAFWDDWREFYWPRLGRPLDVLRAQLPRYVLSRNVDRGHAALGGRPAIARIFEDERVRSPISDEVRTRLEEYEALRAYQDPPPLIRRIGEAAEILARARRFPRPVSLKRLIPEWEELCSRAAISRPRRRPKPRQLTESLSHEHLHLLLGAGGGRPKSALIVRVMALLGIRVNEIIALDADDFHPRARTLHVHGGPKSQERTVSLPSDLQAQLRHHLGRRRTGPLFQPQPGPRGARARYSARAIEYLVAAVASKAGIPEHVYPLRLRKTVGRNLLTGGIPLDQVQLFLGHSSPNITLKRYAKPAKPGIVGDGFRRLLDSPDGDAAAP